MTQGEWLLAFMSSSSFIHIAWNQYPEKRSVSAFLTWLILSPLAWIPSAWFLKVEWNSTGVLPHIHFWQAVALWLLAMSLLQCLRLKRIQD